MFVVAKIIFLSENISLDNVLSMYFRLCIDETFNSLPLHVGWTVVERFLSGSYKIVILIFMIIFQIQITSNHNVAISPLMKYVQSVKY